MMKSCCRFALILVTTTSLAICARILSPPDSVPRKEILPITLRKGDADAQPDDQPENDTTWATTERTKTYGTPCPTIFSQILYWPG